MLSLTRALRSTAQRWSHSNALWSSCSRSITSQPPSQSNANSATNATPSSTATDMPIWAGGDVEIAIHKSLEDMVPLRISHLPGKIFNAPVRPDIVHQVVVWQLARRRAGTAKTKNRSEVAGSGRKVRPQKGTGRSRQGAITSPIFRGGGTVHGPRPRSYDYPLPENVRMNGLRSVLSSKYANGQLWIVEEAELTDGVTQSFVDVLDKYGWRTALVVDHNMGGFGGVTESLYNSALKVPKSNAISAPELNVYDSMRHDMLVLTTSAVRKIDQTFGKYSWIY